MSAYPSTMFSSITTNVNSILPYKEKNIFPGSQTQTARDSIKTRIRGLSEDSRYNMRITQSIVNTPKKKVFQQKLNVKFFKLNLKNLKAFKSERKVKDYKPKKFGGMNPADFKSIVNFNNYIIRDYQIGNATERHERSKRNLELTMDRYKFIEESRKKQLEQVKDTFERTRIGRDSTVIDDNVLSRIRENIDEDVLENENENEEKDYNRIKYVNIVLKI
jgi:hypothetical protein